MVGGWVVAGLVANPICNAEVPLLGDFTNAVTYIATTAAGETVEQTMYANWRLCYLIGGIPLVYGIVLFFLMKETPHWYANAGRFDDAVKVLADIERVSLGTETKRDPSCLVVPPRPRKLRRAYCSPTNTSLELARFGPSTSSASSASTE